MSSLEYRRHEPPGCGGCLLVSLLLVLLTGGAPLLFKVLGVIIYTGLFFLLAALALIWGAAYFLRRKISAYEQSQTEAHNHFVSLLVHILVRTAQLDGEVTREEARTIRRFFQARLRYTQSQLLWVRDLIKDAAASTASLESLLEEFRGRFAYEPRLLLLDLIYQVLFSNSRVDEGELEFVRNIARFLEISPYDQRVIEGKFTGAYQPSAAPGSEERKKKRSFDLLGLESGAGFPEIKSAYRRLSMKYHPDKVRHLGEEFRSVAEEKMKELNEAYEFLERMYGR